MPLPWERDWGGGASQDLIGRVIKQESGGNPNAVSPKGAFGRMQLMPDTAKDPGFGVKPLDPNAEDQDAENVRVGTEYLNAMMRRYGGDKEAALVAYNWGPGNADKWVSGGKDRTQLPRETQGYLSNILDSAPVADAGTPVELDPNGPRLGAIGKPLPWQRDWGAANKPNITVDAETGAGAGASAGVEGGIRSAPFTWGGLGKAAASGLQRGAVSLAGLPGDIRSFATAVGVPENMPLSPLIPQGAPTSEQIQGAYDAAGGPSYQPQNVAEEYARTAGEFAPAVLGGAAGVGRKALQVAIPAALSETGGQVGRKISPSAEAGGRIGGALISGKVFRAVAPRGPTTQRIHDLSQAAYDRAKAAGVQIDGGHFDNFAQSLARDKTLNPLVFSPKLHPGLSEVFQNILGQAKGGGAMSAVTGVKKSGSIELDQFDNMRRAVLSAAKSPNADERRLAGHLIDRLDAYFNKLTVADVKSGDPRAAQAAIQEARTLWKNYRKAHDIDVIMEVAKDTAGQFSVSGNENAIRTGFRQLSKKIARDPREANRWTDDEKKIIRELSRGWTLRNGLRLIGKLAPNTFTLVGAGAVAAGTEGNTPLAIGALGVGAGAKALASMSAARKARELTNLVRAGGRNVGHSQGARALIGADVARPDDQ